MGVYTPDQYQLLWRQRAKSLRQQGIKTTRQVADYLIMNAKGMAPEKTGKTREGLRVKPRAKGHVAESWVPGKFKQNMWANQTAPFRTLHWKKGNKRFGIKPGTKGVYGLSPKHFRWTGQPQFFHLATLRAKRYNPKIARRNTNKALRVSVA